MQVHFENICVCVCMCVVVRESMMYLWNSESKRHDVHDMGVCIKEWPRSYKVIHDTLLHQHTRIRTHTSTSWPCFMDSSKAGDTDSETGGTMAARSRPSSSRIARSMSLWLVMSVCHTQSTFRIGVSVSSSLCMHFSTRRWGNRDTRSRICQCRNDHGTLSVM